MAETIIEQSNSDEVVCWTADTLEYKRVGVTGGHNRVLIFRTVNGKTDIPIPDCNVAGSEFHNWSFHNQQKLANPFLALENKNRKNVRAWAGHSILLWTLSKAQSLRTPHKGRIVDASVERCWSSNTNKVLLRPDKREDDSAGDRLLQDCKLTSSDIHEFQLLIETDSGWSGTNSKMFFDIFSRQKWLVAHELIPCSLQSGSCVRVKFPIVANTEELPDFKYRLSLKGSDLWRPKNLVLICRIGNLLVPIGGFLNCSEWGLSIDKSESDISSVEVPKWRWSFI